MKNRLRFVLLLGLMIALLAVAVPSLAQGTTTVTFYPVDPSGNVISCETIATAGHTVGVFFHNIGSIACGGSREIPNGTRTYSGVYGGNTFGSRTYEVTLDGTATTVNAVFVKVNFELYVNDAGQALIPTTEPHSAFVLNVRGFKTGGFFYMPDRAQWQYRAALGAWNWPNPRNYTVRSDRDPVTRQFTGETTLRVPFEPVQFSFDLPPAAAAMMSTFVPNYRSFAHDAMGYFPQGAVIPIRAQPTSSNTPQSQFRVRRFGGILLWTFGPTFIQNAPPA